jgi:tetratricopeptide (TPR) repeat protein
MNATRTRRRVVVDDSPLAHAIGQRLRQARLAAGLTQQQLAGDRYTKAYISALENGIAKPSMAALNYLAPRLGRTASEIISDPSRAWARIEADLALASGDWQGAYDRFLALLEGAIELSREGDRARAEYWLASAHMQQDNPDEARGLLRGVLDRVRGGLDLGPDFATRLLIGLATLEGYQGAPTTALAYLEEARAVAGDLDTRRRGAFMAALASAYRNAGDIEAAIRSGLQAEALLRSAESDLEVGLVENQLALAFAANGNVRRARQAIREARTVASDPRLQANLADTEASIELQAGNPAKALELADEAIALADQTDHQKARLDALVTRARALSALDRHDEASEAFERAATLSERTGPASRRRQILSAWADTLAALGRHDEAYGLARRALEAR